MRGLGERVCGCGRVDGEWDGEWVGEGGGLWCLGWFGCV